MGRHSSPDPAPVSGPGVPAPTPPSARASGGTPHAPHAHHLLDRLALAGATAVGTGAVMAWAGAAPTASLVCAAGAGVVVVLAAHLAGALPGPARTRGDRRPGGEP